MSSSQFDVFLCHNSEDKPQVRKIAEQLKAMGIRVWLDEWELRPGMRWQTVLQEEIRQIEVAAIFVGNNGLGPWQEQEIESFLLVFSRTQKPLIPVLLSNALEAPELPLFLQNRTWVDFRNHPNPMDQLIWGITGKRPTDEESLLLDSASVLVIPDSTEIQRENELAKLEDLLSSQKWKEADEKTKQIILKDNQGKLLMVPQIREIPLDLLDRVDSLWMEASEQKFGLRVQQKIWQKILEPEKPKFSLFAKKVVPLTDSQAWNQFGSLVGWRTDDKLIPDTKLNFSIKSPPGCFPRSRIWLHGGFGNSIKQFVALMEQVEKLDC